MHAAERLEEIGRKILGQTRTDLYLSLHFLGEALDSLPWQMDLSTTGIGTDMEFMRFNPRYLMQTYLEDPKWMARTYLHIILHCLLLHPTLEIPEVSASSRKSDALLWNLSCDIAVESIIDSLRECHAVSRVLPDFRADWYEKLGAEMKFLTAEKIYRFLMLNPPDPVTEEKLVLEFTLCDHEFWEELIDQEKKGKRNGKNSGQDSEQDEGDNNQGEDKDNSDPDENSEDRDQTSVTETLRNELNRKRLDELRDSWQERSQHMMAELENSGNRAGRMTGTLTRILEIQNCRRMSYRDFLKRYAVVREEARIDPDSFDYGFYNYGMELYGNMPLMEENEYRESKKVEELVIAIDTSASCQAGLVQHFLNETASILRSTETFFHRIELRILESDNQVQKDILIRTPEEMKSYLDTFEVSGGFGTDFRPVFEYVEQLRLEGHLKNIRGLLYYTDGAGIYPTRPTAYETTFIFRSDENYFDRHVPDWCVKVYLGEDDRISFSGR